MVESQSTTDFKHALSQAAPQFSLCQVSSSGSRGGIDLFTDGSCLMPHIPQARLAAWAGTQCVGDHISMQFQTVAHGTVPGQWQTILRAEILAVIAAIKLGKRQPGFIRVWSDNAVVVRRCNKIIEQRYVPHPTKPDHDLWGQLTDEIAECRERFQVFKVASHQQQVHDDEVLAWVFAGNANKAAAALCSFPMQVLELQQHAAAAISQARTMQQELHEFFAKVGMKSVLWEDPEEPQPADKGLGREPTTDSIEISMTRVSEQAVHAPLPMQFPEFHRVRSWLRFVQAGPDTRPTWVTWYELFWSFQRFTGIRSLQKQDCHSKWTIQDVWLPYDIINEGKNFMFFFTHIIRVAYPEFKSVVTKPHPYQWQLWSPCVAIKWNPEDSRAVHDWMVNEAGIQQIRKIGKDLSQTPCALGQVPCEPTGNTRVGLHRWFN